MGLLKFIMAEIMRISKFLAFITSVGVQIQLNLFGGSVPSVGWSVVGGFIITRPKIIKLTLTLPWSYV